ncbi:MAG: peptidyl-prolyl cis-trans isomerase [Lentisphaeria bacterium]|nr:peptidyl-prolyl cis-trans isomerase [Lentisphaeria bacterium]
MADGLDFSLPGDGQRAAAPRRGHALVWLLVLLDLLIIALLLWRVRVPAAAVAISPGGLDLDARRELALKLEKQGLADEAVAAWQQYLEAREADPEKSADIWYRIGVLRQEAGQYEQALAALYRSEQHARLPRLESEIGRRVQECLEQLGRFAALRHELAERTSVGAEGTAADPVVAEIGPTKLTLADLDRLIEQIIANQLSQYEAFLPAEQLNQRKDEMLRQLSGNEARRRLLAQYLGEEVLYRQAREDGLANEPSVRAVLKQAERSILASRLMEREIASKVTITPSDVRLYYDAQPDRFREPEKARLAHILMDAEDKARAAIASVAEGQAFEALAGTLSADAATAAKGGVLPGELARGNDSLPGIGTVAGLGAAVFAAEAGSVLPGPVRSERGWHVVKVLERIPERQLPFEEAREEAYRQLRAGKQQEVEQAFIRLLYDKFNVVVHQSVLGVPEAPPPAAAGALTAPPLPPPAQPGNP